MATANWRDTKNSFRYSMQIGQETVSRTVSGLNIVNGSTQGSGPEMNDVLTGLINTINSLSNSNVSNPKWTIELAVDM